MNNNEYILGIDTSNYTTSVAVIDRQRKLICEFRRLLRVKQGEKGLRQSDALFQHVKNLPELMESIRKNFEAPLAAIAYSSRPRPVADSYMPVFVAGESFGKAMAAAMGVPAVGFSHQEGHIEAVKAFSKFKERERLLACHFSGGTCELLKVTEQRSGHYSIDIIGSSKDISFGQVIDRAGVAMGYGFPAGEALDRLALSAGNATRLLTAVKVSDIQLNLSGIDTQIKNIVAQNKRIAAKGDALQAEFTREIFTKLAAAVTELLRQGCEATGINDVLMAGGVSSSRFIRESISKELVLAGINAEFDNNGLASDNAVGTALLGGKCLWD